MHPNAGLPWTTVRKASITASIVGFTRYRWKMYVVLHHWSKEEGWGQ